MQLKCRLAY